MTNITIQTINSTLVVDSRLIASELGIQHKNLKETIRTYQADFEEFNPVAFETRLGNALPQGGFAQGETFIYLTEDQCYLALTYSKNTPEARLAKVNLVKAFKEAREALVSQPKLNEPTDILLLLEQSAAAIREARALAAREEQAKLIAESKVLDMAPKVELYNTICESGQNITMGELAKVIGIKGLGRNNLFQFLKKQGILQFNNVPYQAYMNKGHFVCIQTEHNRRVYTVTLATPSGVEFVIGLLKKAGYKIPSKAA